MGETLGRYLLQQKIASGGMAEVFLAKQSGPDGFERACVVKRMLSHLMDEEQFVQMFLDEARLVAQLNHPNIAQIFDFGSHEGTYYLAMEHVPGLNLRSLIKEQIKGGSFIPFPHAARIVSHVAMALHAAHEAVDADGRALNIIHRDVSPQNILLSRTGMVKLIDFGIAKADSASTKTKTGFIKGKYCYMSPEQVRGQPLDRRSDLFSLGLVLYELLANKTAAPTDSDVAAMNAILHTEFAPIETHRPDAPEPLRGALHRALQQDRELRYATAEEMSRDLERFVLAAGVSVDAADLARLLSAAQTPTAQIRAMKPPGPDPDAFGSARTWVRQSMPGVPAAESNGTRTAVEAQQRPAASSSLRKPAWVAAACLVAAGGYGAYLLGFPAPPPSPAPPAPAPAAAMNPVPVAAPAPPAPSPTSSPPPAVSPAEPAAAREVPRPHKVRPEKAAPTPEGHLNVAAAPPAQISVDGVSRGTTPLQLALAAGEHTLVFSNESLGLSATRKVHVAAGKPQTEEWRPAKGEVAFRVSPYGEVFRNGKSLGVTPLKPLELYEGHYTFKIVNPDTRRAVTREVNVTAGEQALVKVDLDEEP